MKKVVSIISLFGVTILACNALSQVPITGDSISATATGAPTLSQPSGGNAPSDSEIQDFSLDNVNSIAPEEVIYEVRHYGSGGPGDADYCEDYDEKPIIFSEPTVLSDPVDNELVKKSELVTCGWGNNEKLTGTVEYPDGRIKTEQIAANEIGAAVFGFAPELDDPEGLYIYKLSGKDKALESNVFFHSPSVPRLYYLNEHQILFNNFPSGETVSLYMFTRGGESKWWKPDGGMEFLIGTNGKLTVNLPDVPESLFVGVYSGLWFIPIDNDNTSHSGLLRKGDGFSGLELMDGYFEKFEDFQRKSEAYRNCPDSISTQFSFIPLMGSNRETAKIITTDVTLYSQPRYTARVYKKLKVDQALKLVSGPYCFDNAVWWSVFLPNSQAYKGDGYIAEIDQNNKRYLEKQKCGDLPSRLSWSQTAHVAFSNGLNKNIRNQPGFSARILTTIPEGTSIQISALDSWCVDNSYWWYITTRDNTTGWMTEMQEGVYLLEPAPK